MPPTTTCLYTQSTEFSRINLYLRKYPKGLLIGQIVSVEIPSSQMTAAWPKKKKISTIIIFFIAMHTDYITKERDSDHDPIASSKLVSCVRSFHLHIPSLPLSSDSQLFSSFLPLAYSSFIIKFCWSQLQGVSQIHPLPSVIADPMPCLSIIIFLVDH